MKKSKRKLVVAALVFFSISLLVVSPAQAKVKKLKVNTVYTTTKKVKGITKLKKAKVIAKIGKKTYKAKSNSKGKFTIKIKKKRKQGTKIKVCVYTSKKKVYKRRTIRVKAPKLIVNRVESGDVKVIGTTRLKNAKVVVLQRQAGSTKYYNTYTGQSDNKGKFSVKIPQLDDIDIDNSLTVKVYTTNNMVYKEKIITVKSVQWWNKKPFKGHKAALAGNQGISYQKVFNQYDNSFRVYCKKGYYVRFTIAGELHGAYTETYKKTALGNIYTKKPVGTKKVTLKIYRNKDDKLVESYSITPKKVTLPSKTAEIDYEQFLKDYDTVLKTGKEINKSIGNYDYAYRISKYKQKYGNWGIDYAIGYVGYYFDGTANGSHVKLTAKNGATLYITVGAKASFNFPEPSLTNYDVILKSGQTKKWEGTDFKEGELVGNHLCLKIYAYKDNKLVGMRTMDYYLIQGYADWMFK